MLGQVESLSALATEYAANAKFLIKIRTAAKSQYPYFRRVRGDGNCFYRGYLFAVLEWMVTVLCAPDDAPDIAAQRAQVAACVTAVDAQLAVMSTLGWDQFTLDEFHEQFMELLQWCTRDKPAIGEISERLSDDGMGMYYVSMRISKLVRAQS